jgi:hypothetical protein
MISGNGTIFTYERDALVPSVFTEWGKLRKEYQKKLGETIDLKNGIEIPKDLLDKL